MTNFKENNMITPKDEKNFVIEVSPEVLNDLEILYRYAEDTSPYYLHYSPYWKNYSERIEKGE